MNSFVTTWYILLFSQKQAKELEEPEDVYVLTPTIWNPHSDAYVINEESMLDWEGNMRHEKDHEKRVVLEDIPSDDTMISSLALCNNEQMVISSHFVDQDEDINSVHGFEDENQLYQAYGIHILMPMLLMKNHCLIGRAI